MTREQLDAVEHFIAKVERRQRQLAESTGIPGSFSKAFNAIKHEVKVESTRLRHKERCEALRR